MKAITLKKILLSSIIATIFLLSSCSKESDNDKNSSPEPEQNEEMVLGEETISLTKEITDHVTTPVTGMDIILDNSIKETDLPKEGQILLQVEATEDFPSGFLGRVSKVEKNDNGYKIQTEKAFLDEAFEQLKIEGEMEVDLSKLTDTRISVHRIGIENYESDEYKGYQISYTKKISDNSSIGLNFSQGFIFQYTIDINNKVHKPFASFTLQQKTSISPNFNINFGKKEDKKFELFNQQLKTISLTPKAPPAGIITAMILRPQIEVSIFGTAEGECTLNSSIAFENYSIIGFVYKDGKTEFNWRPDKQSEPTLTANAKFSMNGSIYIGLKCALTARVFSEKVASLSIPFTIGPQISADLSIEDVTKKSYEELSKAHIEYTPLLAEAGVEFALFKDHDEQSPGVEVDAKIQTSFGTKKEFYLLPKFDNMSFERDSKNKKSATVKSTVQHELLFPAQIAYKLTSDKGDVNQISEWKEFQTKESISNPFTHEYTDLKTAWNYTVIPLVKLPLFGEIEATPKKEIEGEIDVTTLNATSQDNILTLFGKFDPEMPQEPMLYGFCYSTTNKKPTINDAHIQASTHADGKYQASISVENNKTYYYCAYIIAEDGNYYYGDTKTYGDSRLKRVIWSFKHDNQLEIRDFLYDQEGKLIGCKYSGDLDNRLSLSYNRNTISILDSEDFYSADMTFDASGKILKGINLSYEAHPVDIATYNASGCLVRINNSTINWANGSLVSVNDKNQGSATITSDVEYNPEIQKFNVALYNLLNDNDLIDYETDCFCFAAFMNKIGAMPKKLCSKIKREGCISRYSYEFNEIGVITKIVEINRWNDEDEDHIFTHEFIYE